jgi:lysophospholipase L1-like esterase
MALSLHIKPARPLVVIYAAAILGLGTYWTYKHYFPLHEMGEGPAGSSVAREPFQQAWRDGPVVFLGLGDSVTAGYGSTRGHSFVQRLTAPPSDEFPDMTGRNLPSVFPHLTVLNRAISGSTSSAVVGNELSHMKTFSADTFGVVVISTGGNDLIHNYGRTEPQPEAMYGATRDQAGPWIADYATRLDGIVSRVKELFPGGAEIFMLTIFDPTDGIGDIDQAGLPAWPDGLAILGAFNQELIGCAKRHAHVHLVDVHAAFLGHGIHCDQSWRATYHADDPGYWLFGNLEDPNDRGYDAIRRLILLAMSDVFVRAHAIAAGSGARG